MNKIRLLILLLASGLAWGCASTPVRVVSESPAQFHHVRKVAVFPFLCNRSETGRIITEAFTANLRGSHFELVDNDRLKKLLATQRLTPERVSEEPASAVGRLEGVDAVITGTASVRAFRGYIDHVAETRALMTDLKTGEVLREVRFTSEDISRFSFQGTVPAEKIGKALAEKFLSF